MFASRRLAKLPQEPLRFPWYALAWLLPVPALYVGFLFHALGL